VIGIDDFNDYYSPTQKHANIIHNLKHQNFNLITADITSSDLHQRINALTHQRINTIIHLAARAGVRSSIQQPLLYEKVNVGGTLKILELAKELQVKHFIFGSSSSVYGNPSTRSTNAQGRTERVECATSSGQVTPYKEDAPCDQPISPYAATKRAGELLCYAYSNLYKIPTTVLRFFTVYGPRNRPDMAAFKFMDAIAKGKPIDFYGQNTSRDYTFVDDITDGILAAINFSPNSFEIFNLGNSSPTGLSEFINTIEKTVGKKAILVKKELPRGDVQTTYANIFKAEKILKWKPKVNLKTGIGKLWEWYTSKKL